MEGENTIRGRGAQFNPHNGYKSQKYDQYFIEGIDQKEEDNNCTTFLSSNAKTLVHKVDSPDVGMNFSANPYQGCEHGCIYCYARNSHQYWDLSAGLDFERKIIVKENSPQLFEEFITKKNWDFSPIHLSGNTDCYQPIERSKQLTRKILQIALKHRQPISIITKNSLLLRDMDILVPLAQQKLVKVFVSITSLSEDTRQKLEPRTVTAAGRLKVVKTLSKEGIPVGVNVAPIIPGLTDHEIPTILKQSAENGALWAAYIIVRLNGQIGDIFQNWLSINYPDRSNKIWHAIQNCHQGHVNDSVFGQRMKGTGKISEIIRDTFNLHCRKNNLNKVEFTYSTRTKNTPQNQQLSLF
ncbi:PA0069 family radical SAM protein [Sphingobacterium faecale]|uniref:PA0069 family radical SAM protein n=1 Tax=Sphingobacterium faecale TaxID=2803775 RepID=A0ABS1QXY9_9SPHI|nr:PA0069 family radical SAM protein [Sphingobacterium faecale]MBL1407297.1 PA0069 family radical SAM protein [Sphingobacterium faecale]